MPEIFLPYIAMCTKNIKQVRLACYTYIFSLSIIGYYIYLYNFEYNVKYFNHILLPSYFLLLIIPLGLFFLKKIKEISYFLYFIPALIGLFLIYTAGGIKAPGIIWVAFLPILSGILIEKKGVLIGVLSTLLSLIIFYFSNKYYLVPNIIEDIGNFEQERIVNVCLFISSSMVITYLYVQEDILNKRKLEKKNLRIENLLRIMVHDLSTPISILKMQNKKLLKNEDPDIKLIGEKSQRSIDNIFEQIEQVRLLKSQEDKLVVIKEKRCNLVTHMKSAVLDLEAKFLQKKIEVIHLNQTNLMILADPNLLKNQIIHNLLTNAIKFSEPKSKIEIGYNCHQENISFYVRDYGIGIPPEIKKNIFKADAKTSRTGTGGEIGTGYGMPLVYEFVKEFNGSITLESWTKESNAKTYSNEDIGTKVTVTFKKATS